MWALPVKSKRGHLTPWGKLLTIMSHHVSARNWTQVLWNSHLSSPIVSAFLENRPRVFCGSGIIFAHLSNHRNPQHNYHFMCLSLVFATCTWKPKIEIKIWHPNPPPCLPLVLVFLREGLYRALAVLELCRPSPSWPWVHRNLSASAS